MKLLHDYFIIVSYIGVGSVLGVLFRDPEIPVFCHHSKSPGCFPFPMKSRDFWIYVHRIFDIMVTRTFCTVSRVQFLICRKRCSNRQYITLYNGVSVPVDTCWNMYHYIFCRWYKEHWYWVAAWVYLTLSQKFEAAISLIGNLKMWRW